MLNPIEFVTLLGMWIENRSAHSKFNIPQSKTFIILAIGWLFLFLSYWLANLAKINNILPKGD
jgi:hypothetical protein